jgi:hypothetical protein
VPTHLLLSYVLTAAFLDTVVMTTYDPCDVYTNMSVNRTVWPVRAIPAAYFSRQSVARTAQGARAWAFFERVEAADAATRVALGAAGVWQPKQGTEINPAPWYIFKSDAEIQMYRLGKMLHVELCPTYNWIAQRDLGIPTSPFIDVYPHRCGSS